MRAKKTTDLGGEGGKEPGLLRSITLLRDEVPDFNTYPFSIPAVRNLQTLTLNPGATFLCGENGSGKSTLIEAIAVAAGMNAEGGSRNFRFSTRPSHSNLADFLRVTRSYRRTRTEFFLRAESFFNVATEVDELGVRGSYGGVSLHEQSHGESFLALVTHRFGPDGLFILDEPEAALSPRGCLSLLRRMHELVHQGSQFIISTHSPILLAFPGAQIYQCTPDGLQPVSYRETQSYTLTQAFLENPEAFFRHLFTNAD
ncbi:MAG: AAA family ATPase [Armatimonadota bacterium]|nr:AAA family ATPase [Armatimonadota bacterium]